MRSTATTSIDSRRGGFSLETRDSMLASGTAVLPGNATGSRLVALIRGTEDLRMPLQARPLKDEEVALLSRWIEDGAPWPEGFSFAAMAELIISVHCLDRPFDEAVTLLRSLDAHDPSSEEFADEGVRTGEFAC